MPSNPDMVMMDTEIIAESPVRLTVAGMGDALSDYITPALSATPFREGWY